MIYTVICTHISDYTNWQCDLLEYSWSRVKQPGKLIRLVACDNDADLPKHQHAEVIRTRPMSWNPDGGDFYDHSNRLDSLQQWLDEQDIQGSVLIIAADAVFRSAIDKDAPKGRPLGQAWLDYDVSNEFKAALQSSTDIDIDTLQPVTWPVLIDSNDLRKLLPRWIEITVAIQDQVQGQKSDMYGFLVAARECRIKFDLEPSPQLGDEFFGRTISPNEKSEVVILDQIQAEQLKTYPVVAGDVSDDWKIWIWQSVANGHSKDMVFKEMIDRGFARHVACAELNYEPSAPTLQKTNNVNGMPFNTRYQANSVAQRIDSPTLEIYHIDDFLNKQECDTLIEIIKTNVEGSTVVGAAGTEKNYESDVRTSESCFFEVSNPEHEFAIDISRRICKVIGINHNFAETMQAQLYGKGGEYKPHYDWFKPDAHALKKQAGGKNSGQRTWSVIVYLNDVPAGGETTFKNADITIVPSLGKVVFWNNLDQQGLPNKATLHQGCPVTQGNKAILTLWFRLLGDGDMYIRDESKLISRYTTHGFEKTTMSKALLKNLSTYYGNNRDVGRAGKLVEGESLHNEDNQALSDVIDIPNDLRQQIINEFLPVCENWSQTNLEFSALHGIRVYAKGASVCMHTDSPSTHIINVILNVAQSPDSDWPLVIDDHMARQHKVSLQPGDAVLYEGARLNHGRPTPLNGEAYANISLHFCPKC